MLVAAGGSFSHLLGIRYPPGQVVGRYRFSVTQVGYQIGKALEGAYVPTLTLRTQHNPLGKVS